MDPRQMFDLTGRTAIVTGASSGLGEGFARTLAAAGATVFAAARRVDRLESLSREVPGVVAVRCDVTSADDRSALVATASASGPIDVLVNNAGRPGAPDALTEPVEDVESLLRLNLVSGLALATEVVRSLPDDYRMPLMLRYFSGADYETMEVQLGLSNGALRGMLHRGLKILRDKMREP